MAILIVPLNILIMNYSLSSFGRGFVLGMGAMSADILYFVLLSLGVLLALLVVGLSIATSLARRIMSAKVARIFRMFWLC